EIASVLAFSAVKNSDKVGLLLFSDQVELYLPPRKGRRHVLRIVREVLGFEPAHRGTDLVRALDFVNDVSDRRAIVFLLSDFQTGGPPSEDLHRAIRQTKRRHDLVALPIEDAREQTLPDLGIVAIEDAETGELVELDTRNPQVRQRFTEIAQERAANLRRTFNAEAVDSLRLATNEPYVPGLVAFFKNRTRKRS
ncbi:MAG TPA: VWA domain-containing protein, partial [Chthoniobacteraceae bacterium]